ncbi:P-loop containing nucleoside triphosphate hydrolase protein [Hyaloraphidium curvatum]|nr:P-loop containing nucleoside triphosphate hydrolase protein [Hyaloraphidium curvatum]
MSEAPASTLVEIPLATAAPHARATSADSKTEVDSKASSAACEVPTELVWENVEYKVSLGEKKGEKQILKGVSGRAKGGEVLAILGGSGAGKTTLLNTLAGRIPSGTQTGRVLLNGRKRERASWKKTAGYVEQEDIGFAELTVKETLTYAARLRMPSSQFTKEQKLARVDEIIRELGLTDCQNTKVGDPQTGGISGGQRKRVSIAIELIANPAILFLDEPTSGLDSFTAFNICESLQNLAKKEGKLIICSIHMPRETILDLFDNIILMSQGSIVWHGPPSDALDHFSKLGFSCPKNTNPADYFLDLISVDKRTPEALAESTARYEVLSKAWNDVSAGISYEPSDEVPCEEVSEGRNNNYFTEVAVLTDRAFKNTYRNPAVAYATIGQTVVLVLLVGLVFFRLGYSVQDVQSRAGVLFFTLINGTFLSMMPVLQVFVFQRKILRRERAAGTYRVSAAFFANLTAQLPLTLGAMFAFSALVYYMVNLNNGATQYFRFILGQCLVALVAMSLGFLVAAGAPSLEVAQIIAPMLAVVFIIFGGSFVNADTIPAWIGWLQWISILRYGYTALMQNEFYGAVFECPPAGPCAFPTGEDVINFYGLSSPSIWACFAILFAMAVFFLGTAAVVLRITTKPNFKLL